MIQDVVVKPLKVIADERGYLMEMLRCDDPFFQSFGQVYCSVAYPGVVKGWHYHKVQWDHFVIVSGMMKVVLYDMREGSPTKGEVNEFFMGEKNPVLVRIPPGVPHGMKGMEPMGGDAHQHAHRPVPLRRARRVPDPPARQRHSLRLEPQGWLSPRRTARPVATWPAPASWSPAARASSARTSCAWRWPAGRARGSHVLDALTYAGNKANLVDVVDPSRLSFQHGDIRDPKAVAEAMEGATHVVNFAAESMVDRSIDDPGSFVLTDVYGVFVLLEEAKRRGVARFIQISTDEVYGEILGEAATEDYPLTPRNPYAASKAGGDRLAFAYHATYGMPVVITRCSNNYGPYQYPEKLVPLFVTNALEDEPLPVYGSGRNTRDWIHVDDHCRAVAMLLEAEGVDGEVFNIGAGNELDVLVDHGRDPAPDGQARHAHPPRRGPTGPRSPLRAVEHQADDAHRLAAAGGVRRRGSRRPSTGTRRGATGGSRSSRASSASTTSACTASARCWARWRDEAAARSPARWASPCSCSRSPAPRRPGRSPWMPPPRPRPAPRSTPARRSARPR